MGLDAALKDPGSSPLVRMSTMLFSRDPVGALSRMDAASEQQQQRNDVKDTMSALLGGRDSHNIDWATPRPMSEDEQRAALVKLAPEAAIGALQRKLIPPPPVFKTFQPGEVGGMVDSKGGFTPTFAAPPKPEKADVVTLGKNGQTKTLNLSTPLDSVRFNALTADGWTEVKTPAAQVNVNNTQESAYAKKMGEGMADEYLGLMAADRNAGLQQQKIGRLGSLLDSVGSGRFTGTTSNLKSVAKGLGVDLDSLGITDNVAPAQAAQAISNEIALQLRNPAGGAGMPGALSDKDREFLMSMVPSIENTPEGNKLLLDYWTKVNQRSRDVARMARDYKRRTGNYDEGFYDELAGYAQKNPLFAGSPSPGAKSGGARPAAAAPKIVTDLPADAQLGQDGYYRSASNPGKRWKAAP